MPDYTLQKRVKPSDRYTRLNDYELKSIYMEYDGGGRVDLKPLFMNLVINEDINYSATSGSILLKDSTQLLNTFPISGHEKIIIEFRTPGIDSDYIYCTFRVVQITDRSRSLNERNEVYKINFISESALLSRHTKISKSYKGKISDIVKEIHGDYFSTNLDVDKTNGDYRYVIPYWTPLKTMEWLSMRAVPVQNQNETNFFFFETLQGHNFKSLSELSSKDSVIEYKKQPSSQREMNSGPDHARQFTSIQELQFLKTNQKLDEMMSGAFSSVLLQHDVTTKKWGRTIFNYNKEINKIRTTSPEKITVNDSVYTSNPNSVINLTTKQQQLMGDDYPNTQNHETWLQKSNSYRVLMDTIKIKITVAGNSRLNVGDMVDIYVPKSGPIQKNENEWYDKQASGKYMILSLRHAINQDEYKTVMTLGKSGYEVALPDKSTFLGIDENTSSNLLEFR